MRTRLASTQGFTLLEVIIVGVVVATMMAIALMVLPAVVTATKSDSGALQCSTLLRSCREQAITQRRNMQVAFTDPNQVQCLRREVGLAGTTLVETGALTLVDAAIFEQGVEYRRFPEVNPPDTPNAFSPGPGSRVFTGPGPYWFTPEGTFVDANGDVTNGTVFLGDPARVETARAVTVFGATALIENWLWNGATWVAN